MLLYNIGDNNVAWILPLHSSLSSAEQSRVFRVPPKGIHKIVVSTNIAETSVTIEDVVFVIDTCRVKENRYDESAQISTLVDTYCSQVCIQVHSRKDAHDQGTPLTIMNFT